MRPQEHADDSNAAAPRQTDSIDANLSPSVRQAVAAIVSLLKEEGGGKADVPQAPTDSPADQLERKYVCRLRQEALLTALNLVKFKSEVSKFQAIEHDDKARPRKIAALQSTTLVFEPDQLWLCEDQEHGRLQAALGLRWITAAPAKTRAFSIKQYVLEVLLMNSGADDVVLAFDENAQQLRCTIEKTKVDLDAEMVTVPERIPAARDDAEPRSCSDAQHLSLILKLAATHSARNANAAELQSVTLEAGAGRGGRTAAVAQVTSPSLITSSISLHYRGVELARAILGRVEHTYRLHVEDDRWLLWAGSLRAEIHTSTAFPPLEPILEFLNEKSLLVRAHVGELVEVPKLAALIAGSPQADVGLRIWQVEADGKSLLLFRAETSKGSLTTLTAGLLDHPDVVEASSERPAIPLAADVSAGGDPAASDPAPSRTECLPQQLANPGAVADSTTSSGRLPEPAEFDVSERIFGSDNLGGAPDASGNLGPDEPLAPSVDLEKELEEVPPAPELPPLPAADPPGEQLTALLKADDPADELGPALVTVNASLFKKALENCRPQDLVELRLSRSALVVRAESDGITTIHVLAGKN